MFNKLTYIIILLIIIVFTKISRNKYECFKDKFNNVYLNQLRSFYGLKELKKLINSGYKIYNAKDYINKKVSYNKNDYKTILIGDGSIDLEDMNKVYRHCYLGLRLTPHDGVSYQVIELGLMGIKTIHNGDAPSALNYSNMNDVKKFIKKERYTIGTTDANLANKIYNYCKFDKKTFNVNSYFDNVNPNTKFEQILVSKSIIFFKDKFIEKNKNFNYYSDINKPTIFFGVYHTSDLNKIMNHKGYGLIVFGGTDTYLIKKNVRDILSKLKKLDKQRFAFIAQSKFIENDLKKYNINYYKNKFYLGDTKKNPIKKGNCIYMYIRKKQNNK